MTAILLINPNTSADSLAVMLGAASAHIPPGLTLRGICAERGPPLIVNEADLRASGCEVVRLGTAFAPEVAAIVVAAFGDPGSVSLRDRVDIPVIGIGEAAIAEAAKGGRRFGIATTTPALAGAIEAFVRDLGWTGGFTGVRVPDGDPLALAADPALQEATLAGLARDCFDLDAAEAVIVGGGPLSGAARALRELFGERIIEPVPAAMRCVAALLNVSPR